MRCLPECGYNELPNNGVNLKIHVETCMLDGACKDVNPDPVIVWRDGGFTVVREADKDETIFDLGIERPKPYEEPEEAELPEYDDEFDDNEYLEELAAEELKKI